MSESLPYIQIILSAILMAMVMLQRSEAALGSAFGESGGTSFHNTRRGFEKYLFYGTIAVAALFSASAFLALIL